MTISNIEINDIDMKFFFQNLNFEFLHDFKPERINKTYTKQAELIKITGGSSYKESKISVLENINKTFSKNIELGLEELIYKIIFYIIGFIDTSIDDGFKSCLSVFKEKDPIYKFISNAYYNIFKKKSELLNDIKKFDYLINDDFYQELRKYFIKTNQIGGMLYDNDIIMEDAFLSDDQEDNKNDQEYVEDEQDEQDEEYQQDDDIVMEELEDDEKLYKLSEKSINNMMILLTKKVLQYTSENPTVLKDEFILNNLKKLESNDLLSISQYIQKSQEDILLNICKKKNISSNLESKLFKSFIELKDINTFNRIIDEGKKVSDKEMSKKILKLSGTYDNRKYLISNGINKSLLKIPELEKKYFCPLSSMLDAATTGQGGCSYNTKYNLDNNFISKELGSMNLRLINENKFNTLYCLISLTKLDDEKASIHFECNLNPYAGMNNSSYSIMSNNVITNFTKNNNMILSVTKTYKSLCFKIKEIWEKYQEIKNSSNISNLSFWDAIYKNVNNIDPGDTVVSRIIEKIYMKTLGDLLQELNGIIKYGGYDHPPGPIHIPSNSIIPYDYNGNATRCILSKDKISVCKIIYFTLFLKPEYINSKAYGGFVSKTQNGFNYLLISPSETSGGTKVNSRNKKLTIKKYKKIQKLTKKNKNKKNIKKRANHTKKYTKKHRIREKRKYTKKN